MRWIRFGKGDDDPAHGVFRLPTPSVLIPASRRKAPRVEPCALQRVVLRPLNAPRSGHGPRVERPERAPIGEMRMHEEAEQAAVRGTRQRVHVVLGLLTAL